jgi:hypothetical protein
LFSIKINAKKAKIVSLFANTTLLQVLQWFQGNLYLFLSHFSLALWAKLFWKVMIFFEGIK